MGFGDFFPDETNDFFSFSKQKLDLIVFLIPFLCWFLTGNPVYEGKKIQLTQFHFDFHV